jgi:hypothetical protein
MRHALSGLISAIWILVSLVRFKRYPFHVRLFALVPFVGAIAVYSAAKSRFKLLAFVWISLIGLSPIYLNLSDKDSFLIVFWVLGLAGLFNFEILPGEADRSSAEM